MDKSDIQEAIESTIDWRQRKAVEYPDDARNKDAVKLLTELSSSLDNLEKGVWEFYGSLSWTPEVTEALSTLLGRIGFQSATNDARELLSDLFQKIGREAFHRRN